MKSIFGIFIGFLSANLAGGFVAQLCLWIFATLDAPAGRISNATTILAAPLTGFALAFLSAIVLVPLTLIPAIACILLLKRFNISILAGYLLSGVLCAACALAVMAGRAPPGLHILNIATIIATIAGGVAGGWAFRQVSNAIDRHERERVTSPQP